MSTDGLKTIFNKTKKPASNNAEYRFRSRRIYI